MTLRFRIALVTAVLAAATAVVVATVGYRVTAGRLDAEIAASIDGVVNGAIRSPADVNRLCGVAVDSDDEREPRGRTGGRPRDVSVQCLGRDGTVLGTSPDTGIPVTATDRAIAAGTVATTSTRTADVDGEPHRIVTVRAEGVGAVQVARSLAERNRVLDSLLRRTALLAALATALAAAAGAWVARRIALPLARLSTAAEAIAERGRLEGTDAHLPDLPRSARRAGTETAHLSHAFTTMLASLRQSREEQARLVQDAGHELRTPLTSIRTNVSLLRRPDLPDTKRAAILADLDSELRELTALTDELVALAAHDVVDETPAPLDLGALVEASAERWRRRSDHPFHVTTEPAVVLLPPTGAQRIVDNLVGNAVKFSPPDRPVEVQVRRTGTVVELTVRDRGPGIAPDDLPHVFDRFYRADAARSLPGSGLGLSIVRDVLRRNGGDVVASNPAGGGALLTVTIPAVPERAGGAPKGA